MNIRNLITSTIMTMVICTGSWSCNRCELRTTCWRNVIVEGTELGGVTDGEGKFTIEIVQVLTHYCFIHWLCLILRQLV